MYYDTIQVLESISFSERNVASIMQSHEIAAISEVNSQLGLTTPSCNAVK